MQMVRNVKENQLSYHIKHRCKQMLLTRFEIYIMSESILAIARICTDIFVVLTLGLAHINDKHAHKRIHTARKRERDGVVALLNH